MCYSAAAVVGALVFLLVLFHVVLLPLTRYLHSYSLFVFITGTITFIENSLYIFVEISFAFEYRRTLLFECFQSFQPILALEKYFIRSPFEIQS